MASADDGVTEDEASWSEPPWEVPRRFNFTRDVVEALAVDHDRPALTFIDRDGVIDRLTFAEVASHANRWAQLLVSRGLEPGDRLLIVTGKTRAWPAVMLGAIKAGLVAVPCVSTVDADELDRRARHAEARLVVADRERAREVGRMGEQVEVVVVEDAADELRQYTLAHPTCETAATDIALILYSRGTTGDPKGSAHTHAYMWSQRVQAEHWLTARSGDLVWCTADAGSTQSIWNVLLGPWLRRAETVIHESDFDPLERLELIQRLGVTVLCQSPAEYEAMAAVESPWRFDLHRVRHAVSTGEQLSPEVLQAFKRVFELTVYDGYGQTENTVLVANVRGEDVRPGSMGRPIPGHDVAVLDGNGEPVPSGREGEIALRVNPPSLFASYWDAPAETEAAFRGEWYLTGDRALLDADGYLWFTGRTDQAARLAVAAEPRVSASSAASIVPAVVESTVRGQPELTRSELAEPVGESRSPAAPAAEPALEPVPGRPVVRKTDAREPGTPASASGLPFSVAMTNISPSTDGLGGGPPEVHSPDTYREREGDSTTMDLRLFARTAARHKLVTGLGLFAAFALAFLAYVSVSPFGDPVFRYRTRQIWTSQVKLQIQEPGFVEGAINDPASQGDLANLAPLYAQIAKSDAVKRIMKVDGPIPGGVRVSTVIDSSRAVLPIIQIDSFTTTGEKAAERASRQARAFTEYIAFQQRANKIPDRRRIGLTIINGPTNPYVAVPRKKTLPILVFVSMLVMVGALVLAIENVSRSRSGRNQGADDGNAHGEDVAVPLRAQGLRSSAPSGQRKVAPGAIPPGSTAEPGTSPPESRAAGQERWSG